MNKVQYLKIRSLADVRAERLRVGNELGAIETRLRQDYRGLTRMFSLSYVVGQLTGRANQVYNLVQWGMSGYQFVLSMIEKYKTARTGRRDKAGDDEKVGRE